MYNHAPEDYDCPFCQIVREIPDDRYPDLVYHDDQVTALISLHDITDHPGHVLIIPNAHYENIYDLPDDLAASIQVCARKIALAMKQAYACEGITTRQNNEPAGGQDVWHYHLHIYPRFAGDRVFRMPRQVTPAENRAAYAARLRKSLGYPHPLMGKK